MQQASLSGLILPNLQQWLDPSLPDQGLVNQNHAAAMAAFAKAGYTMQRRQADHRRAARRPAMTIVLPNSFSDWVAAATEIKNELAAVGIKVSLDEPQYAQYSAADAGRATSTPRSAASAAPAARTPTSTTR